MRSRGARFRVRSVALARDSPGTPRDADRFDRVAREPRPRRLTLSNSSTLATCRGEIALSDVRYEPTACPANQYVPNKKNTVCLRFTAVATNNLKRKVEAANIFGFVEDKQGNSAVTVNPTGTSRTVLSGLDAPVPPGKSEVSFIVTVFKDSLDLGDLKLRGFKAEPSMSDIEKRFKPFDECEMDPSSEGCDGAF